MLDLLKPRNLQSLKSVGYHLLNSARDKGEDTAKPLAFVGLVTVAIGVMMLSQSMSQQRGR